MENLLLRRVMENYPLLNGLDPAERDEVLDQHTRYAEVPAGTLLFDQGAPCQGFPMVLSGNVRVARGSPNGRSLELYRVPPGEICVVSASCLFGQSTLAAHGQTTEPTELVLLSPPGFERWVGNTAFRRHVFGIFADRLADLMALVEAVAFQRLDERLARTLLQRGPTVIATHQTLADDLGTAREIVTRLLRRFEREGWLTLGRERIDLLDVEALRAAAAASRGA